MTTNQTKTTLRWLLASALASLAFACGDDGDDGDGAMPRGPDEPPTLGVQIDRVGRPAISTALAATFEADSTAKGMIKDQYNRDASPSGWVNNWSDEFAGSLAILDALDATCGNQLLAGLDPTAGRYSTLAGVLADDRLFVNSASGTCGVYLGVEGEAVGAVSEGAGGCGGRTPNDDVIERSYSVLAAGVLSGVDDTIASDDRDHDPDVFPFLAGPN